MDLVRGSTQGEAYRRLMLWREMDRGQREKERHSKNRRAGERERARERWREKERHSKSERARERREAAPDTPKSAIVQ